jgi:hypothetical protein
MVLLSSETIGITKKTSLYIKAAGYLGNAKNPSAISNASDALPYNIAIDVKGYGVLKFSVTRDHPGRTIFRNETNDEK